MDNNRFQNPSEETSRPRSTGTENIVRKHLSDPNHVITDEDIRNVEVGKSDADEVTTTGAEVQAVLDKNENNAEENAAPNPWVVKK